MGTRLYIANSDLSTDASVLGFAPTSVDAFRALEASLKAQGVSEHSQAHWEAFDTASPEIRALDSFSTFGWGKLTREAWDYLASLGLDDGDGYGEVSDPAQVDALLRAMGNRVRPGERERVLALGLGLSWS